MIGRMGALLATLVVIACTADPGYGGRTSGEWIQQLSSSDENSRADAAEALERVLQLQPKMPNVVRALVRALADTADVVRTAAGRALATQGVKSPEAAPGLAAMLADSAHPGVRVTAARLLGLVQTRTDTAVASLSSALRDSDSNVRASAAQALGLIGPAAAPALPHLVGLSGDPQSDVRVKVIEALIGTRASPEVALPVLERALDDSVRSVRATAAYALGSLGPLAAPALAALVWRLFDPDAWVRSTAAFAIGRIGPSATAAIPSLIALQRRDTTSAVAGAVEAALAALRGQSLAMPQLPEPSKVEPCRRGSSARPSNCSRD